jgi:ABC-2 type transport system permease protein
MKLRPGSAFWLLRHELRMFYFRLGGSKAKGAARRGPGLRSGLMMGGAALAIHLLAWKLLSFTSGDASATPAPMLIMITATIILVFSLMLSQAFKASIEVLFERGDLDLLLSSPLSSRSIFVVRLGAVVVGSASLYLFLLAPFAHVGLALGQPRWLAIYPVVLGAAAVAASAAMLMTLALVRLLGVRRTRVVAQVLGAVLGAFFFLLSQFYANGGGLQHLLDRWLDGRVQHDGGVDQASLLWLPARAVLGAPLPMLALAALGAGAFLFTVHTTHGFFVRGAQLAVSQTHGAVRKRARAPQRFGMSLTRTILLKEWRTIMRDPQLISQVLLQLLYLLPMCFIFAFRQGGNVPGMGASMVFMATSLTTALAWLVMAAEDAPDLLRASPAAQATVGRAKLAAAVMPSILLLIGPVAWVALRAPAAAAFLLLCATGSALSGALIVRWCAIPAPRGDFRRRGHSHPLTTFLEFAAAFACSGVAWIGLTVLNEPRTSLLWLAGATVLLLMLAVVLALAWSRRDQDA